MDLQKFLNASLAPRQETVKVPELAAFFGENEKPEWVVRGLNASELAIANDQAQGNAEKAMDLIAAFTGDGDKAQAVREAMGLDPENTPEDISRRIEMLTMGSVSPELGTVNRDVAVKMAEMFPTQFYNLTNRILSLTGQGADEGKRKRSGKTIKSAA